MTNLTAIPAVRELKLELEREHTRLCENLTWLAAAERAFGESQAEESSPGGTLADIASDLTEQTFVASLEQIDRKRYDEVEAALHRIDEGTFGDCERCGKPINLGRLVAVPWTRYCVACSHRNS